MISIRMYDGSNANLSWLAATLTGCGGNMPDRDVTLRRNMQQVLHCVQEALSVIENQEDLRCALDDICAAQDLMAYCKKIILERAKNIK